MVPRESVLKETKSPQPPTLLLVKKVSRLFCGARTQTKMRKTRNKTTFTIPASSSTHATTRNAHRFTATIKRRYVMLMSVVCQPVGVQPGCSVDGSLKGDNAAVEAALQKLRMEK